MKKNLCLENISMQDAINVNRYELKGYQDSTAHKAYAKAGCNLCAKITLLITCCINRCVLLETFLTKLLF